MELLNTFMLSLLTLQTIWPVQVKKNKQKDKKEEKTKQDMNKIKNTILVYLFSVFGNVVVTGWSCSCPEVASISGYAPIIVKDPSKPNFNKTIGYIVQQV